VVAKRVRAEDAEKPHTPVFLKEIVHAFAPASAPARNAEVKLLVDCTLGAGGHSTALLKALPAAHLLGVDRDPDALSIAVKRLREAGIAEDRYTLMRQRFDALPHAVQQLNRGCADLVLLDLGVSSMQLDSASRGFAYRKDGPLDMRMDGAQPLPAVASPEPMPFAPIADPVPLLGAAAASEDPDSSGEEADEAVLAAAAAAAGTPGAGSGARRVEEYPETYDIPALHARARELKRLATDATPTALDLIDTLEQGELADLLFRFGDERYSKR
jgi:16S rRNA C1402 N4-methylase RsmH